jgi:hypothetical protein
MNDFSLRSGYDESLLKPLQDFMPTHSSSGTPASNHNHQQTAFGYVQQPFHQQPFYQNQQSTNNINHHHQQQQSQPQRPARARPMRRAPTTSSNPVLAESMRTFRELASSTDEFPGKLIDASLIERIARLGSGVYGEVWRYKLIFRFSVVKRNSLCRNRSSTIDFLFFFLFLKILKFNFIIFH